MGVAKGRSARSNSNSSAGCKLHPFPLLLNLYKAGQRNMSSNSSSQSSNDEEGDDLSNYYDEELSEEEEEDEWEPFSETDRELIEAIVTSNDATTVQHALQNGANVNCHSREFFATPLMLACRHGYDSIVRILLEAGADARSNNRAGWSVIHHAISRGHMSIVEMLLNHGNGLLESLDSDGCTPLLFAIHSEQFEIVHFLLDRGANALATTEDGSTALMRACQRGADLRLVRRLLSAGVPVDARDKYLCTALHYAANRGNIEATQVLIVEHNANMFAVDQAGETPFDYATCADSTDGQHALLECYGNKLTQEHGRLALHAILAAAAYSFIEEYDFHPPQNPLQIHAPLGELTLQHFRALLHSLDIESIRNRDATGKVPIHLACHANAPVEILSMLTEMDAHHAISRGHMSIVEMLLNHGNGLLESLDSDGCTPLLFAIHSEQFEIVHFLLDRGANALATTEDGSTALMRACQRGADLRLVRRLLSAGVPVDARDKYLCTALHYAANRGNIEATQVLIVEHNANMFAVDQAGETPFDYATCADSTDGQHALLECYGNKLTQEHGRLALHAILAAAAYSFIEEYDFHPPQNPLQIHAPLGELTLQHFRALLHSLDIESIRNRDATGKVPIHLACHANAPVEILSMLTEMDPTTLQIADHTGALPIHSLCDSGSPTEHASLRYIVEQGGVGTLAARNREGALPLHALCGSTSPSLRTVQYLIQSFPGSVAVRTNAGQYPFMIAACESSTASLSVIYELYRVIPNAYGTDGENDELQ